MSKGNRQRRKTAALFDGRAHVAKRKQQVEKAIDDSIKDNLAERVIDNFLASVAALPFEARLKFALAVLRGNVENLAEPVEELAEAIHKATGTGREWVDLDEDVQEFRKKQALGLFTAAGVEE